MENTGGRWLKRIGGAIDKGAHRSIRVALTTACIGITSLVGFEIISRTVFQWAPVFIEDIVVYCVVWMYMLGAIYGTYKRDHLKGGIVHLLFREKPRASGVFKVGNIFIALGLCCLLSIWSWQSFMWDIQFSPRTQVLHLPLEFARLSMFVGFVGITAYFLVEAIDIFRVLLRHSASDTRTKR